MNQEILKQTVQGMAGLVQALRLYPPGHPSVKQQARGCMVGLGLLFREKKSVSLGLLEGTLFCEDFLFVQPGSAALEIRDLLEALGVKKLEFLPPLSEKELLEFLLLLKEGHHRGEALKQQIAARGISSIQVTPIELKEEKDPREVYQKALEVVRDIFQDIRLGRIPSTSNADRLVTDMVEITLAQPHALFALSMIKDYDNYTFNHSVNVAVLSLMVGRACGVPEKGLHMLSLGGLLHDVGKLKIDRNIINKPGRLTDKEFEEIKQHPVTGADIVRKMEQVPREVVDIVHFHHLHHNREGYPQSPTGRKISPLVDMATIADTYDAMTTLRAYQSPISPRVAIGMMRDLSGTVLHPGYLERFIRSLGEYPVGTLVRLDSNEIGLVVKVGDEHPENVRIKILMDESGRLLGRPSLLDLSGKTTGRIVAEVDPFLKKIDVTPHLV